MYRSRKTELLIRASFVAAVVLLVVIAVIAVLAYCASMFWAWSRAERLRSVPGAKEALPSTAGFFTGAAFLWIWSAHYRRLGDQSLTLAVQLARVFFVVAMALWAASIFLGL